MRFFGCTKSREDRKLNLNGKNNSPGSYCSNELNNKRYSFFSFVPKVLYNEFKFFFNLFFLFIALSQFIPMFKVGFMITFVAPLAVVLSLNMLKEAYDDYKRYVRDRELNNEMYEWLNPRNSIIDGTSRYTRIKAKDLKVGMIIKLE